MMQLAPEVRDAVQTGRSIVALESTIITHGMPYPKNVETALAVEQMVRENGAIPATIAVLNGRIRVGLNADEIDALGSGSLKPFKAAAKDLSLICAAKLAAGTTVSATMRCAELAGIKVFATGGIGGVHRGATETFDISSDLQELSKTPVVVVSAGCKSILDLPKTLEYLETMGVPVMGFETDFFPAFHARSSGIRLQLPAVNAETIAKAVNFECRLRRSCGILVVNPIPLAYEIPLDEIMVWVDAALAEAKQKNICGKEVTPFLLQSLAERSGGRALSANIALIKNNARIAAQIALAICQEAPSAAS